MAGRVKHPVLGNVETIQVEQTAKLPTLVIEVIELSVLVTIVFFLFFKFRNGFPKEKRHLNVEE